MERVENATEMKPGEVIEMKESDKVEKVTDSDTKGNKNVYVLSKPFEWEDKKYTELNLDFEKLIGEDMIAIENEMAAVGEYALSPEISTSYLSKLAAKAAGVSSDVITHLPIRDFGKVKNRSRNFLIETGLGE